jgi:hypothetical protein
MSTLRLTMTGHLMDSFMRFYLQSSIGEQLSIAGLVGSLTLLSALVGAPSIGWLYDKGYRFTRLVVIFGALLLVGVSMNFINTLYAAIISTLVVVFLVVVILHCSLMREEKEQRRLLPLESIQNSTRLCQ